MCQSLKLQDQETFDELAKVLKWNKLLLSFLGLWPASPNSFIFAINFGYFAYHMVLEYLDLFLFINDLEHVIENLTESTAFTQILVSIAMLRKYNRQLGEVVAEASKDYDAKIYKTDEESRVFIEYMKKAKMFIKLLCAFVTMMAGSYYAKPITSSPPEVELDADIENATMPFILPYHFYIFYEVNDTKTWVLTYLSQFPFVFISGLGQTANDCLMLTLLFHVSGKLAALAVRISVINTESDVCRQELQSIVMEHDRLLKMGQILEEAFSATLLFYLVGATSLICVLGYQVLYNFARGQTADLATFIVYIFVVFLILYVHCVVGETLVTESFNVCKAYYDCLWYEMSPETSKTLVICLARSQKPLGLSAGKFKIFCLTTLTDVVKTSMAYLSVLRTFLIIEY